MTDKYKVYDIFKYYAKGKPERKLSFIHIGELNEYILYLMENFPQMSGSIVDLNIDRFQELVQKYEHKYQLFGLGDIVREVENTSEKPYLFTKQYDIVSIFTNTILSALLQVNLEQTFMVIVNRGSIYSDNGNQAIYNYCHSFNMHLIYEGAEFYVYCKK